VDRLRAMRVFVAVASAGSLSAAARKLGQPLTTISRQLAQLEDELGTSLVARTTRRLTVTDAGRLYLETCRHVLDELTEVEERLGGRDDRIKGDLVITAPVVFGRLHVLPVLAGFLARYPEVDARLHLVDRVIDLTEEGIDVAVRIGVLPDSALLATKVGDLTTLTCASPGYLRERGRPREPGDLVTHDCISFVTLVGEKRSWSFNSRTHGRRLVRIHARLAVTTAEAAIDAAIAGLGITRVLSYQAAQSLKRKALVTVLDGFDDTKSPIQVVRREVRRPSAQARLFADYAARELRARLK
jgi:DNA-binding transcriptional LysR family regulator